MDNEPNHTAKVTQDTEMAYFSVTNRACLVNVDKTGGRKTTSSTVQDTEREEIHLLMPLLILKLCFCY